MLSHLKPVGIVLALVAAIAVVAVAGVVDVHHIAALLTPHTLVGIVTLAGPFIPIVPKSVSELQNQASPSVPRELEAVPWCFYDTQTYVSASTTTLSFFANTNADKTITNMEAAGAIPMPNYFEITHFTCDFLFRPTNSNAVLTAGALDDMAFLIMTRRAQFLFNMNQKVYGSYPLRAVGGSGAPVGLIQGTTAANQVEEYATNSMPGANALHIAKAITIAPNNNFGVTVNFASATTLGGDINIVIGMWGQYSRKVS